MSAAWLQGDVVAFDLETTGPDPETARIVTAAAIQCGAWGSRVLGKWLVNPGVPIPAEALPAIEGVILDASLHGLPLVIMNAGFDLTVKTRELARLGLGSGFGAVLDPLVIDRGCERYRKGKRTLPALADYYRVKLGEAHSADGDALTAARVVWAQARRFPLIADLSLAEMQKWQRDVHLEWATHFQEYLRTQGKTEIINTDWPVRRNDADSRAA